MDIKYKTAINGDSFPVKYSGPFGCIHVELSSIIFHYGIGISFVSRLNFSRTFSILTTKTDALGKLKDMISVFKKLCESVSM